MLCLIRWSDLHETLNSLDVRKSAKVNREPIILVDNPMKAKHAKPAVDEHGLCLANPARVLVVGGCGASKTTTILNCIARGAM